MRFKTVSIAVSVLFAVLSASTLAQSTKQPESGEQPAASKSGQGQEEQNRGPDKVRNAGQAQPQGPTGPLETGSGGAPASSVQGDTPPAMQTTPQGSSEQSGARSKSAP
jgi:hypothetical protein